MSSVAVQGPPSPARRADAAALARSVTRSLASRFDTW